MLKQTQADDDGDAPVVPLSPVAAERALSELRSLWLVPTLILSLLVALLLLLNGAQFPLFPRTFWLVLAPVVFVVVYGFVHRRAVLLARTLRAQAAREMARLGEDVLRAEAKLEDQLAAATAAREFAERILQNVPGAVLVLDADADTFLIRGANVLAEAMPDGDRQQDGLSGRRLGDVFPGLEVLLAAPLARAAQGESVTLADVRYDALERGVTYWNFFLTPQRDPQKRRVTQIIMLAVETTDRIRLLRERERHADESERHARVERRRARELEATLGSLTDGVVLCDAAGRLLAINRAAQAILGPEMAGVGASVEDWAVRIGLCYPSGQPVPPGSVPLTRTLRTGLSTDREEFLLAAGGVPRIVELSVAPVMSQDDPGGDEAAGAVAVLRDVTDLRRSRQQEAVANARVGALVQVSRRLNATLVESEIHAIVTEGARALLPDSIAAGARCLLYGREGDRLTLLASNPETRPKRPRTRQQSAPPAWHFDAKSPLLWETYIQRLPVVCDEITADVRFAAESDRLLLQGAASAPAEVRSVLVLPLVAGSAVSGHLTLTSPEPGAFGDPRLQDALTNLASLTTIARANARLYDQTRQRAEELDALWTVGQAVATQLHLRDVADTLTERVRAVFGAELCTLSLWETAPGGQRHLRWQGKRYEEALLPEQTGQGLLECGACDGVSRRTAESGELNTELGVSNPPFGGCRWRAFSGQSGTHSVLSAPLRQGKETLGSLTVYRSGDAAFTPEQVKLLRTLATLAVTALRNAQSFAYEHRIAQTLQKAWLPEQPPTIPGLEIAASYAPARTEEAQIGGDYYDFLWLGPRRLAFFIGDISGKGLSAAVYTALAKYTLRAFAVQGMSPQEVVSRANTVMVRDTQRELFSTLFYGVWDGETRTLTYVNAGHEPPQWVTAAGPMAGLEVIGLDATGPILGAFAGAVYQEETVTLAPGDVLALYTDGLPDCRSNDGTFFGEDGIRTVLQAGQGRSPAQIAEALRQSALEFSADHRLRDDLALLLLRVV